MDQTDSGLGGRMIWPVTPGDMIGVEVRQEWSKEEFASLATYLEISKEANQIGAAEGLKNNTRRQVECGTR